MLGFVMTNFTKQLLACGYTVGSYKNEVYPGGPGLPAYPPGHYVQAEEDRIRVYTRHLFGEPYTKRTWHDEVTVAVFLSVEEFFAACPVKSEPGSGPNDVTNVWD